MKKTHPTRYIRALTASIMLLGAGLLQGAVTDIATSPMITSDTSGAPVKPNLMFIIDDSGSMDWDFLPDWTNDYYCKRANGTVKGSSGNDDYSVDSGCCRNNTNSSSACMSGTGYANTGTSANRGDVPLATSDFNSAYYNPAITYTPPKNADGTSKTSQTCAGSGGTVSGTSCTGGWSAVQLDAYGIQEASSTKLNLLTSFPDVEWCDSTGLTNCRKNTNYFYPNQTFKYFNATTSGPYYYLILPGEYCDSDKLTNCTASTTPTGSYTYPAKLRWCSDTARTTCQAIKNATYKYARYPTVLASTSTSGSVSTVVTVTGSSTDANNKSLTVNTFTVATGPALITGATTSSTNVDTATDNIISKIGNGYVASAKTCSTSGGTRTCTFAILAPSSGTCPSGAFSTTQTNGAGATAMTVAASPQFTGCTTPGQFVRVNIDPAVNSYPYPGTAAKHPDRTDCAGTTCTYLEEMANFANWFTYYRTRMQMMKTASSLAFHSISDNYRVGFLSINNAGSNKFLNIDTFDTTQKTNWYAKLFAANPSGSTPLRSALSTAGLIYGGSLTGNTLNGSTVTDPIQYSCQKNFTIISTDGYWNTGNDSGCSSRNGAGCKLDKTSAVGNTDGMANRPYTDGAVVTVTDITPMTLVERKQTIQNTTTTTPWTRSIVTNGAACTVSPAGAAGACTQDAGGNDNSSGSVRLWCLRSTTAATAPGIAMDVNNECVAMGTTPQIYACRGQSNSTNYPGGNSAGNFGCITDGSGNEWCVYSNGSQPGTSACQSLHSNNNLRVCKRNAAVSGTNVTTQPQTYNQVAVDTVTSVNDVTSTYNRTVVTTNGVVTSDTNGATTTSSAAVSSSSAGVSDTGAPGGGTTWTNGTATTTCMAVPTAPGTSAAVAGTATVTPTGAASISTLATTGPTAGTTSSTSTSSGGTSDTLADVAYYYYDTDLRPAGYLNPSGVDVGTGDYDAANGTYSNNIQRMVTYTLGLGINGYMKYKSDYATASSGDYYDIANGATSSATKCTWQASGTTCNWPTPSSDSQANIDDLWHAAVNGRGQYFSAGNPGALAAGLSGALSSISAKLGAAAAATTSNPNITTGDNFLFSSDFRTSEWSSQLQRLQIDTATGNIITEGTPAVPKVDWDAQPLLDAKVAATSDSRTIYTFTSDTGTYANKLKPFQWSNLTATEQAYFTGAGIASLPQFCATGTYTITGDPTIRNCLTAAEQTAASGDKLILFLRGQTGYEDRAANTAAGRTIYYRNRTHTLGDIVSSEAVYVKAPITNYADTGFNTFKTSQSSNIGMVYVAANDGMLHAFKAGDAAAGGGTELWAYVPTMAMPKMFNLASMNYKNDHKFLVDGTPVVDYAYFGGAWHTILVGGLGAGGAGYYALDITDPTAPKALWEFKRKTTSCAATVTAAIGQTDDCDLGYSYGNPVVTKLMDGTWVVLVTSGYNNTTPGDGQGYLYVLNPATGEIIRKIGTGAGSNSAITGVCATAPCPSGLAKIAAWVDSPDTDNTTKRVYGGDLFGNLWRFDINDTLGAAGYEAQELAVLKGPAGNVQPITARPELGESNGIPIILIGTGRFLGDSDKSDPMQSSSPTNNKQSFYGIKDPLTATSWGNTRTAGLVQQTVTVDAAQNRSVSSNSVNLSSVPGWFLDLPDNGERANTDPALALGTVIFTTNVPTGNACSSAGQSFIYNLDFRSGLAVSGSGFAGRKLGNALATRPVVVQLQGGAIRSITKLGDTTTDVRDVAIGSGSTNARRVSWRQLIGN